MLIYERYERWGTRFLVSMLGKLNSICKCDTSLFYKFNFFLSCLIFLKFCASLGDKNPNLFLGL